METLEPTSGEAPRHQRARALRSRARVELRAAALEARAERLAEHGVRLMLQRAAREQEPCVVKLDLFVNGDRRRVQAKGAVVSCACAGMEGFRVAVRFTEMDQASAAVLDDLLQGR